MASHVLGTMDHLGIDKADRVGWSDGAIIGLELAINHPERLFHQVTTSFHQVITSAVIGREHQRGSG